MKFIPKGMIGSMSFAKSSTGRVGIVVICIVIALLIVLISVGAVSYYTVLEYNGELGDDRVVTVEIPEGASVVEISNILKREGIIKIPLLFTQVAKLNGRSNFKFGRHELSSNMAYPVIMDELEKNVSFESVAKVTIPEGYELRQIVDLLVSEKIVKREEFLSALEKDYDYPFLKGINREQRLEGYLFPATYEFAYNASPEDIIKTMLNKFANEFDISMVKRADEIGMSIDQVVILASIIEREAASDDDRGLVSSVFHNRLMADSVYPYLQSCATVQYILKERKPVLSLNDIKIESPYNTYINKGLPVGPIASPGKASMLAALYPIESDYYFFVVDSTGNHVFSRTLEEHNRATP